MRRGVASLIAAAALMSMPPGLGQLGALRIAPGPAVARTDPPKRRRLTAADHERIAAAQAKRERRRGRAYGSSS